MKVKEGENEKEERMMCSFYDVDDPPPSLYAGLGRPLLWSGSQFVLL